MALGTATTRSSRPQTGGGSRHAWITTIRESSATHEERGFGRRRGDRPSFPIATLTASPTRMPPIFEYACHEGNYAMRNILSGARAQEEGRRSCQVQEHQIG